MVRSKPLPPPPPIAAQLSMTMRKVGASFVHIQDFSKNVDVALSQSLLRMPSLCSAGGGCGADFDHAWANVVNGEQAYDNTESSFRRLNAELNGVVKPSSLMLPTVGTLCENMMSVRAVSHSRSVTYTVVSEQAVCQALEAGRRLVGRGSLSEAP